MGKFHCEIEANLGRMVFMAEDGLVKDQDQGGWLSSETLQHQQNKIDSRPLWPLPDSPRAVLMFRQRAVHCLTPSRRSWNRSVSFMSPELDEEVAGLLPCFQAIIQR